MTWKNTISNGELFTFQLQEIIVDGDAAIIFDDLTNILGLYKEIWRDCNEL